jgi:hypothetical protein
MILNSKAPNTARSGFVGVCAIYKHFSGFGVFLLSGIFPAHPQTTNANRWAASNRNLDLDSGSAPMIDPAQFEVIEKEFPYRMSWFPTLLMIILCGTLSAAMFALAASDGGVLYWLLGGIIFSGFVLGAWISILNLQGNLTFKLSRSALHIPFIWNSKRHRLVRFEDITRVKFIEYQGNLILEVEAKGKKYPIAHAWFPSLEAFQEVVQTVQERMPTEKPVLSGT